MKRFYKMVSTQEQGKGYAILLDGKPVKTPGKLDLVALTEALANAIVQEWANQEESIMPDTMPLTQILTTRIERVPQERIAMTAYVLKYLDTDLICYPAAEPAALAQKQEEAWAPWRTWFAERFGTALETTTDIQALQQPAEAHRAVENYIEMLDNDHFTVLQLVVSLGGSLVLGLAFIERAMTPEVFFNTVRVEEMFKAELYDEEKYGPDPAQSKKDDSMKIDLRASSEFLDLIQKT